MALTRYKPTTAARRFYTVADFSELTKKRPEKSLLRHKVRSGGRNSYGRATNINTGGGHKQRYRVVDMRRDKLGIPGKVVSLEYDPNRTVHIALIQYADGEKRYISVPQGLRVGQTLLSGPDAEIVPGNTLPLRCIPVGQAVHNVEIRRGGGAVLARSAGVSALYAAREGKYATLKLPSGEMRKVDLECLATIGVLGNADHKNELIGKAGRSRWLGRRPHNRAVTKNPVDHPMGGGEGKSAGGRHPCSFNGIPAKGYKTRSNKRTDKFIVRRRSKKGGK
jgi:large subunit ribosomal protein L2